MLPTKANAATQSATEAVTEAVTETAAAQTGVTRIEMTQIEMTQIEMTVDERVLVFAPYGREAALTREMLARAGLHTLVCRDAEALRAALQEGGGAVLLTGEALTPATLSVLSTALSAQPRWSDVPLLLCLDLGKSGAERLRATEMLRSRWSVSVLEPPLRRATLTSVVGSALRARRRQYQVRDLLTELETFNDKLDERVQTRTAELHNSEARFSKVFYASPLPISVSTLAEGRFIDLNDSALKLLGYERDEVLGRTAPELRQWAHEHAGARPELLRRLETEGSLQDVPIKFCTKAGELRDGLAAYEVIKLEGEACLLSMFSDVTERKRNEAELMQAVQEVMSDTAWFSRSLLEKLAQVRAKGADPAHQAELAELTPREKQVLERVAQGWANRQIAADLDLTVNTVRNYLASVYSKLDLHTRAEAVVWARERGLGSGA